MSVVEPASTLSARSEPQPTRASRDRVVFQRGAAIAGFVGALLTAAGLALPELWMICLGTAMLMLAFALGDLGRVRQGGVTPVTIFALSSAANAVANMVGLRAANSPVRDQYFIFAAEKHLQLAVMLALAGCLLTVLGFKSASGRGPLRSLSTLLPPLRGFVPDRHLVVVGAVVSGSALVVRIWFPLPQLGTIISLLYLAPQLAAFVLARAGTARRVRGALPAALVIAIADGTRALMYDYLRGDILAPFVAFTLGALLGSRSFRPLRTAYFVPIYAFAVAFIVFFGTFGALRSGLSVGVERVAQLGSAFAEQEGDQGGKQSILSRLTSFNQLSQVGRVVEEDGFLQGATLDYLGYAFIPRFIWREKPEIAKGAWFALRIGQANLTRDGRIMNSINMTIPGELYLNFGWMGVLIGCLLFGAMMALLWSRTGFWERPHDVLGTAFGFYLLWLGAFLGADLQILVTLIALYLLLLALGAVLSSLFGKPSGAGAKPTSLHASVPPAPDPSADLRRAT